MDWLATYSRFQIPHIVSAIEDYEHQLSTFDDTIDRLYDALDIWSCPSDVWADPELSKWAAIFNSIEQSKQDGTPLSKPQRAEINEAMASLKQRAQEAYYKVCCKHALQEITAYEHGRLHLGTLVSHLEWLAEQVHDCVPDDLYRLLFDEAADLEVAFAMAYERHPGGPTGEQLKSLNERLAQTKQLLQRLAS